MPKIRKLSAHEIQKIAAGEVIERPANIVKELIENAIDAHATEISIYLIQAGKKSIRILDNGYGMSKEDAYLCFEHHATSKIQQVQDLQSISTFGFRGEALSSIAAVSTTTLVTRQSDDLEGLQLTLKNGACINECAVPATVGTDITIEHLFDNIPARKKFLKTKEVEWRHIQQLFFAIALDYTNIAFKLFSEKQLLFNCPAVDSIQERWSQLGNKELETQLIPLQVPQKIDGVALFGVISNQQYGRYDRSGIYFFVNNRWVKDYKLNRSLINGYQGVLPTHQYPIGCIKITIDPTLIDVNIHPRKEEVQFLHPHKIYDALQKAVSYTLESNLSATLATQKTMLTKHPHVPINNLGIHYIKPQESASFVPFNFDTFFDASLEKTKNMVSAPTINPASTHSTMPTDTNGTIVYENDGNFQIVGTYKMTYILLEQENGLLFIDQHAAHERILYEQFKKKEKPTPVQLLFPEIVSFTKNDIAILTPYLALLCTYGIEVEIFSETQLTIKSTPVQLKNSSMQEMISNCIAMLHQEKNNTHELMQHNFEKALLADMACKAAIKAGDTISKEHIVQLLNDLEKTDNRFCCPHGRPTSWHLPHDNIKKKFKRDYQ